MRDLLMSVADYYAETARGGDLGPRVRNLFVAASTPNDLFTNTIAQYASDRNLFAEQTHRPSKYCALPPQLLLTQRRSQNLSAELC